MTIFMKRLERGLFAPVWLRSFKGEVELGEAELALFLEVSNCWLQKTVAIDVRKQVKTPTKCLNVWYPRFEMKKTLHKIEDVDRLREVTRLNNWRLCRASGLEFKSSN